MKYLDEQDVYLINGDEMRKILHALWMARALRALTEAAYWVRCGNNFEQSGTYHILAKKWNLVYRKCREKAKELQ